MTKCNKPYPTIGDLIKDKDYDYISYRLTMIDKSQSFFAGCFKSVCLFFIFVVQKENNTRNRTII